MKEHHTEATIPEEALVLRVISLKKSEEPSSDDREISSVADGKLSIDEDIKDTYVSMQE